MAGYGGIVGAQERVLALLGPELDRQGELVGGAQALDLRGAGAQGRVVRIDCQGEAALARVYSWPQ